MSHLLRSKLSPVPVIQVLCILWLTTLSILPDDSFAHQGATGVVKERMDMMKEIGDDMKAIKAMVQRKRPFDAEKIAAHAESMRKLSMHMKKVFPEGSIQHPSEALPSIWRNWNKFSSLADQLVAESEALREVAKTRDQRAVMKQFARVGKTCRGCHTDFRKKQDK